MLPNVRTVRDNRFADVHESAASLGQQSEELGRQPSAWPFDGLWKGFLGHASERGIVIDACPLAALLYQDAFGRPPDASGFHVTVIPR